MTTPDDAPESVWPPGQSFPDDDAIALQCGGCGMRWRVHRDLGGYKLRCRCGLFVGVAARPERLRLVAAPSVTPSAERPASPAEPLPAIVIEAVPLETAFATPAPLAPLQRAPPAAATRQVVFELVLLAAAFWGPAFAIQAFAAPHEEALLLPLASAATSLLVLLIGLRSRADMFAGLHWPRWFHWIEAAGATVVALGLVHLYTRFLHANFPDVDTDELLRVREDAGIAMALFAVSIVPGIFEELAFRGLIQGRLARLLDPQQALIITASTFALAHGATLALPIHAALGFYLCWLRSRSQSLLPGMLFHAAYNGALVLTS